MASESGYSNQKKLGISQFKTIQHLGGGKHGSAQSPKSLYEILPAAAIVSISDILGKNGQAEFWNIELTSHTAVKGNILRFTTGVAKDWEFEIFSVIDLDNFYVLPISDKPSALDEATVMGWITNKVSPNGESSVTISSAPTQYKYDGVDQTVIQDTVVPANNRALPNLNFIIRNGVQVPITKDTGTPANTVGMPVEIVSVSGTEINITAGDINVQTSHTGANPDSMQIGDGTTIWGIEAVTKKGLVKDDTAIAALGTLLAELQLKADLTETQPVSLASLPLGTGAATEAKQDTLIAIDFATEATLADVKTAVEKSAGLGIVPFLHDEIATAYIGATTDISTVTYKLAGATVATLTMGYDGSNRLISVVRT